MTEDQLKEFARQLRQPEGAYGREVGEKMNRANRYINQYTIEELAIRAHDRILELGMGNGFFVKDILAFDPSVSYTGYDFSQQMVDESTKRNAVFVEEGRAQFVLGEAENMPFADESFTKAFTINTIYFWENKEKILSEFRRVLEPRGKLLIAVRPKTTLEEMPFTRFGFNMFTKEDITTLLTSNSFKINEVIEKTEPEHEINGKTMIVKALIVCAEK